MAAARRPEMTAGLPPRPGTYVLFLRLRDERTLAVGRLGRFRFPPGLYAYIGSGRGPGGLAARVGRHLRHPKPLRWHVDYLRVHAEPVALWLAEGTDRRECAWAQGLARLEGAVFPAPGFGASDCHCPSHLILFSAMPDLAGFAPADGIVEVRWDG